jgi:SAM-dependent methyltransferase
MTEATTGRQYDRWVSGRSLSGLGFSFLASVPGSMLVNTPVFQLDKNLVLKPEHRVLDVGCGRASLLQILGARVRFQRPAVGIDLSRRMLSVGRREVRAAGRTDVELVQAAGTAMPFTSDSFDVATCSYVVKHLDDKGLLSFLRELLRVLKPGGFAVIWEFAPTGSNALNAWHRWLLSRGVETCNLRGYGELAHAATSAGFEWVENAHLRPFLLPPIPRVSIVVGKPPEEWRERTGLGRARRAAVEAAQARAATAAAPTAPDTGPAP